MSLNKQMNLSPVRDELNLKLDRIREYLDTSNLDALLLRRNDNFAWATCGGRSYINLAESVGAASLLITSTDRFVLTNNIEAQRMSQEEGLGDQGWEILSKPWYEGEDLIGPLTKGLKLGADGAYPRAADVSGDIRTIRSHLTPWEGERFRELGCLCAAGMAEAVSKLEPGLSEYQLSAELGRALESRGVQVVVSLVAVDERVFSYRHPLPTSKKLDQYAMLVLCGRKGGLICSLSRLIHFGPLPEEIRQKSLAVARVDAVMIQATRPGRRLGDVFRQAQDTYASEGYPEEWKFHHQGGSVGYAPREFTAGPGSTIPIMEGQAFAWNPSIRGTKSEDTILIGEEGVEILSEMADWPLIDCQIGEEVVKRPAILVRT